MLSVALVEPEIPPNTGNVARLCAASNVPLHIVGVTGFAWTIAQCVEPVSITGLKYNSRDTPTSTR